MAAHLPRIAHVPHTSKRPEACPYCGGRNLTSRGTRKKKLESPALAVLSLQTRVHARPPGPTQQDVSPSHDPFSAHRLQPWLLVATDRGSSKEEDATQRLTLDNHIMAQRAQAALQLPPPPSRRSPSVPA